MVDPAAAPAASKLAEVTLSQFAEPRTDLIIHFSEDDEASDVTLVVWDFGGQKVSCTIYTSDIRLIMTRPTPRSISQSLFLADHNATLREHRDVGI